MKKYLAIALMALSSMTWAKTYEISMLNNSAEGSMPFEPGYLHIEPGDTVVFKATNKGHWVQSRVVPDGAEKFLSKEDEEFSLTLDKEGIYVYICPPHRAMNMAGIIQVGKDTSNLESAKKEVEKLEKRATENKGRLFDYLDQVK